MAIYIIYIIYIHYLKIWMNMPEVAQRRSQDLCKQLKQKALQHQLTVKSLQLSLQSSSSQMFVGVLAMALQPFTIVLSKSCSETFWKTPGKENILLESLFQQSYRATSQNFIKKEPPAKMFSSKFCQIFQKNYLQKISRRLLLLSVVCERLLLSMYCQQ